MDFVSIRKFEEKWEREYWKKILIHDETYELVWIIIDMIVDRKNLVEEYPFNTDWIIKILTDRMDFAISVLVNDYPSYYINESNKVEMCIKINRRFREIVRDIIVPYLNKNME